MRLLGKWNWWVPAWARRVPAIGTALLALALVLAGCAGPILAVPPAPHPTTPPAPSEAARPPDPQPILLPRDDAPHDRLTEWWYYTGHLHDDAGRRFGFEYVIFRAERGGLPVSWASHLALTDETEGAFRFAQRTEIGPQVDASEPEQFDLRLGRNVGPGSQPASSWSMEGGDGSDHLSAIGTADPASPGKGEFGIALDVGATGTVMYHDVDGWIDFGPGGGSYYYSRPSMSADGLVTVDGEQVRVTGQAWFDHQWGDFIAVGGGGWDWFAVSLADDTGLTLSLVRNADGSYPLVYGTIARPDGRTSNLPREAFTVQVTDHWTSPTTGATYPSGWRISIPGEGLTIDLEPTVPNQELDTRASTGRVLGGFAGGVGAAGWGTARRRGLCRAHRLRAGRCRRRRPVGPVRAPGQGSGRLRRTRPSGAARRAPRRRRGA
jgi:predicted secreted hydrolase